MTASICPVPACGARRKRGHAMCRNCWSIVPREAKSAVHRTWRAYRAAPSAEAALAAILAYRTARDAAIDAVVARR